MSRLIQFQMLKCELKQANHAGKPSSKKKIILKNVLKQMIVIINDSDLKD